MVLARAVPRLDRLSILRAVGQRPVAAGLVRALRPRAGRNPLLPLCREQYRQPARAVRLPFRGRAIFNARLPDRRLALRLLPADCLDRAVRRARVLPPHRYRSSPTRGVNGVSALAPPNGLLGGACLRSVG